MNEITRTGWDVLDEARAMLRAAVAGVYAPALEPAADADDAAALLGYLGRSPGWAA
jgi:hypothetical protein